MSSDHTSVVCRPPLISLLGTTALSLSLLAGCSGGGGGGGGGSSSNPADFRTAEFNRSAGLDQISAAEGYARITGRQGGDGVRIAVLDNGVDADHPDLQGAVAANIRVDATGPLVDGDHGTPVAGIIAGSRNGTGTHGVAYNSSIVNIQLNNDGSESFLVSASTTGILTAAGLPGGLPGGEADIMNLSLGGDAGPFSARLDAMRQAASRGKIMVMSAGNIVDTNGNGSTQDEIIGGRFRNPVFPAQNATDPDINGLAIVVGATTLDDDETSFTYRCGAARDVCLFAPGQDIAAPQAGGGTGTFDGTSYSAPLVAGAAAVVKAAFPGISNRDVVQRLLSTAEAIDINGDGAINDIDADIAGQGLLDLNNALDPQGAVSVATGSSVDGSNAPLDQSALSLGNGFAFRGDGADLLGRAVAFDADGFPFAVNLIDRTRTQSRDTGLSAFLDSSKAQTSHQQTEWGTFAFQLDEDPQKQDLLHADFTSERSIEERDERVIKASFHSDVSEELSVFGRLNQSGTVDAALQETITSNGGGLFQPGAFLTPYDNLAGPQSGGGFSYALTDDTTLRLAAFTAGQGQNAGDASLQKMELSHKTVGDVELRLGYGWLSEDDRFLGSESQGAFGGAGRGDSQFLDLSIVAPVTDDVRLFGAYSSGWTDMGTGADGATLFNDWSTVRSEAFGVGLAATNLVEEGDGFTVMVGQPLRVSDGSATVSVPVGRTESGDVLTENGKIDLSPETREIATEMAYRFALDDDDSSLSAGAFARFNPDHDPEADPDFGVGLRYQLKF